MPKLWDGGTVGTTTDRAGSLVECKTLCWFDICRLESCSLTLITDVKSRNR